MCVCEGGGGGQHFGTPIKQHVDVCLNSSKLAVCSSLVQLCMFVTYICHCRMEADRKVYQLQKAQKRHGAPGRRAKAKVCYVCVYATGHANVVVDSIVRSSLFYHVL